MSTSPSFSISDEQLLRDGARLRQLARRLVADEHEREDLVQEGFLRALGRRFVDRGHSERWLRTTLRHSAAEGRRAAANLSARERAVAREEATSSPEDVALRLEAIELVARALRSLREPYRGTLTQLYVDDLSPSQVARLAGVSIDAVHQRKHRGLELMRAELDRRSGGRESWIALCVPLANSSRRGGLVDGAPWLAPLAVVAAVFALVIGVTWFYGSERAAPVVAARAEGAVPVSESTRRVASGHSGNSRSTIAGDEFVEVRVVRSGTLEPVPAATIQGWRLPEAFDAEATIRAWLERGVLEERTRDGRFEQVTGEDGRAFVPRATHGLLVTGSFGELWGLAVAPAGDSGPVRVELFPDADVTVVVEGDGELEGLLVGMGGLGYWGFDFVTGTTDGRGTSVLRHAGFAVESRKLSGPIVLGLSVRSLGGRLAWRHDVSLEESPIVLPVEGQEIAFADIRIVDDLTGELIPGEEHIWVGDGSIRVSDGLATLPIPVGVTVDWNDIGFEVLNRPGSPLQASSAGEHIAITLTPTPFPPLQTQECGRVIGRLLRSDGSPLSERYVSVSSSTDADMTGSGKTQISGAFEVEVRASTAVRQPCELWFGNKVVSLSRGLMIGPGEVANLGEITVPEYVKMISGTIKSHDGPLSGAEIQLRDAWGGDERGLATRTQSDGSFEFPKGPYMGGPGKEYVLVVSHPGFGPHHRKLTVPREDLSMTLSPARAACGRVLLDASIPSDRVWVEASGYESDLGWTPYDDVNYVPTPSFVRTTIQPSGDFELRGLGSGRYTLRVGYFGAEAFEFIKCSGSRAILFETTLELSDEDAVVRRLDLPDLRGRFHCSRVTIESSHGRPVSDALIEVHGDNEYLTKTTVDTSGSALLLVPTGARLLVKSEKCFWGEVVAPGQRQLIVLEPRPRIDFTITGGRPRLDQGLSFVLRVEDMDGSTFVEVEPDEHGRAHCVAPARAACRVTYVVRRGATRGCDEEECGQVVLRLEGLNAAARDLAPPAAEILSAATTALWGRADD